MLMPSIWTKPFRLIRPVLVLYKLNSRAEEEVLLKPSRYAWLYSWRINLTICMERPKYWIWNPADPRWAGLSGCRNPKPNTAVSFSCWDPKKGFDRSIMFLMRRWEGEDERAEGTNYDEGTDIFYGVTIRLMHQSANTFSMEEFDIDQISKSLDIKSHF